MPQRQLLYGVWNVAWSTPRLQITIAFPLADLPVKATDESDAVSSVRLRVILPFLLTPHSCSAA
jgi:hypothetical protein